MTHVFTLEVKDVNTEEIKVRDFSDKLKYNIIDFPVKSPPTGKRLNPKKS